MNSIANIFMILLNYGIKEDWDLDKKRTYRQVNSFNLSICILSLSALALTLGYKFYGGFFVELTCLLLYASGFYLVLKERLKQARTIAILTFEMNMFIATWFALSPTNISFMPWYSPVFLAYMIYPLTAALFDKSVFLHMFIALLQIISIQVVGFILIEINFPSFPIEHYDLLNIIICVYTITAASVTIYLVYSENQTVKNLEIERSNLLEKALLEVEDSRAQIRVQAEALKKLNSSKDRFFSIIAHDLKSPYSSVLGLSEILKDKSIDDPSYYKYAKHLNDAALNTYSLLENLLEWSRAQLDQVRFEPDSFLFNEVAVENIKLLGTNALKKNITINNEIDKSLYVWADKDLVGIIIRNLLINAIKFTNPGGNITITSVKGVAFTEIAVTDNGIGMSEELAKRLFRIEKKQSRLGTSQETGTGLGLFLCKEYVEMHGGKIWVESQENIGTSFYFTLPLAKQ